MKLSSRGGNSWATLTKSIAAAGVAIVSCRSWRCLSDNVVNAEVSRHEWRCSVTEVLAGHEARRRKLDARRWIAWSSDS